MKSIKRGSQILGILAIVLFGAVSCNDAYLSDTQTDAMGSKMRAAVAGNYAVEAGSTDGFNFTLTIDQSGAKDISHMIVQLVDCNGNFVTIENFTSAKVNGTDWPLTSTTGTDCKYENAFVKFDNFNFDGGVVVVEFTVDVQTSGGYFLIKSAQDCFEYAIEGNCDKDEKCYDFKGETAWAAGTRYVTKGNWATYTSYTANSTFDLFAGQSHNAGSVTFSPVVGGMVTININLTGNWEFADVKENVKIQGYSVAPKGNPSPGQFANKGTAEGQSFSITVPAAAIYGIHIDLGYWFEVECVEVVGEF
jgi:hypothetical protein